MGRKRAQQAKLAQLDKTKSRRMKGLCGLAPLTHPVVLSDPGYGAAPMYVSGPLSYAPPPVPPVMLPPPPLLTSHPPGLLDASAGVPWPVAPPGEWNWWALDWFIEFHSDVYCRGKCVASTSFHCERRHGSLQLSSPTWLG